MINQDETLTKYLNSVKNKVKQEIEFITKHHNQYKIITYKLDGCYTLEYYRFNCLKQKFEYQNGCNLYTTKERLIDAIGANIFYLYNKL